MSDPVPPPVVAPPPAPVVAPVPIAVAAPKKRILVNIENPTTEIPEARRNQYVLNEQLKANVLTALIHAHSLLCTGFGLAWNTMNNISATTQVTSIMHTIHTVLRQQANPQPKGSVHTKVVNNFTIKLHGVIKEVPKEDAMNLVRDIFRMYGLEYTQAPFPAPWIGMMAPYITFMSCFKHRFDEVRNGVSKFEIGKNQVGDTLLADLGQFGINSSHHIHCEGITYPPTKRSSIAQSIGPLAQLVLLNQSRKNQQYSDKWKKAAARSIAHFPNSSAIIDYIYTQTPSTVSSYLSLIGDILTITGSRSSVKAFFPFSVLFCNLTPATQTQLTALPVSAVVGQPASYTRVILENISSFKHSGRGAFAAYNAAIDKEFTINMDCDANVARQMVFHGIWGSHLEDLNVLKYMTGVEFLTRQQVGNAFRGKGTTNNVVFFKLPPINFYAKLSQALPTDKTTGGQQQVWNRVTFSGKRRAQIGDVFSNY